MVKKKTLGSKILDAAILILTALTHWVVFYFIIITACKSKTESARFSLALPKEWALLENLKFVFTYNHGAVFQSFYNSLILTACSIFVLVIVAAMAAFVLQRRRNRICQASNKLILAGLIVPASVIPTYWMLSILGVANTLPGLILVEVATLFPFATMMYKGFIATLPREIDEAALLDGCGSLRLFFRIIFPLLKPITAAVVILRSIVVYNDFQNPQYFMSGAKSQTVQLFTYSLKSAFTTDYGHLFAAILVVAFPMIVLYAVLNRSILEGMVAGSVKG